MAAQSTTQYGPISATHLHAAAHLIAALYLDTAGQNALRKGASMAMLIAAGLGPVIEQPDAPGPATLPAAVRDHLGHQLQATYEALTTAQPPQRLLDLIAQLSSVLSACESEGAATFRQGLMQALPDLRAFALSLAGDPARADDLVQETLLKAWAKQAQFVSGTNLMAWLCTILRNQFYTDCRKRKREVEDADGAMAAGLTAAPSQEHGSDLHVVMGYIGKLPPQMREALLLVGAQGLTYDAAAEVMGCQTGTVKSRVSRARSLLTEMLGEPLQHSAA